MDGALFYWEHLLLNTFLLWPEGGFEGGTVVPILHVNLDWQITFLCSGEPWGGLHSCWSFFLDTLEKGIGVGRGGQKHTVRHTQTQTGRQMRRKQRERGLQTAGKSWRSEGDTWRERKSKLDT